MRAVFLGTPAAAVPSLAALADVADVGLVVTMPDAPKGRSRRPAPPPIREAAREFGFATAQPASGSELLAALEDGGFDLGVVVAYGRILTTAALATTRFGFVNVHFSLLPRWRGAAPVERAILAGDDLTGVSLMVLNEGLDTGPVIAVTETPIDDDETAGSLTARLSYLGADVLSAALPEYLAGRRDPAPQLEAGVTYARRLTTAEARLDPAEDVVTALRKVRAYNPRPGAWLSLGDDRLKVWAATRGSARVPVGVVAAGAGNPLLGIAGGSISLDVVQAAGKAVTDGASWMRGRRDDRITVT